MEYTREATLIARAAALVLLTGGIAVGQSEEEPGAQAEETARPSLQELKVIGSL
ncbi:MAG: hypothetical protein MK291_01590 [Planctomycetes bacterium]|nr:hypothetical protein [Planctomycetota bacterium]